MRLDRDHGRERLPGSCRSSLPLSTAVRGEADDSDGGDTCVRVRFCFSWGRSRLPRACRRPDRHGGSDRASAGTVVFIHDQEPPNLQGPWVGNNLYATSLVLNNIWYGGQIRDNKANLVPRLFTLKPKIVKQKPLTIAVEFARTRSGGTASPSPERTSGQRGGSSSTRRTTSSAGRVGRTSSRSREGQKSYRRLQEAVRGLGGAHLGRRLPGAHHRGSGHEQDVPDLDARLQRSVDVRQLAEGRSARGGKNAEFKAARR